MKKKILVLENDSTLEKDVLDYVKLLCESGEHESTTVLLRADTVSIYSMTTAFTQCDVLVFKPTLISSQFILLGMLMYELLQEGTLSVKEIRIIDRHVELVEELEEIFSKKRKYIEELLKVVKLYQINYYGEEKKIQLWKQ